jgi:hypothetical protein
VEPFQRKFGLPAIDAWPWPVRWRGSGVTIVDAGAAAAPCP